MALTSLRECFTSPKILLRDFLFDFERKCSMKKFIFVLFDVLGFALKLILLFSLAIVGMDLINKHNDEKNAANK